MENNVDFFGGAFKKYHSDIGEVISFVPRYQVGGSHSGVRNAYFPRQRLGYGWGQTILSFFRPFLKKGIQEVASFASKVAGDALEGQNLKESLKKHAMTGVSNILQGQTSVPDNISEQVSVPVPKKRVSPAVVARRKPQFSKLKRGVSGKGNSNKKRKVSRLNKKFPILELM